MPTPERKMGQVTVAKAASDNTMGRRRRGLSYVESSDCYRVFLPAAAGMGMDFSQREISKREPQVFTELLLKHFGDRVCMSAVRTFVVAVFHQCDRSVSGTLGVIVRTDRHFQVRHNSLISEDVQELQESHQPLG